MRGVLVVAEPVSTTAIGNARVHAPAQAAFDKVPFCNRAFIYYQVLHGGVLLSALPSALVSNHGGVN
jgi:hypothetical protein